MTTLGNNKRFFKAVSFRAGRGMTATVRFDDGSIKILDARVFRQGLKKTEFTTPLFDADTFIKAEAKDGDIVWPNGFDLWGHDLYERCRSEVKDAIKNLS